VEYEYDGLGRRTVKRRQAFGILPAEVRHYYYSDDWQVLQERVGTGGDVDPTRLPIDRQYVWGVRGLDDLILRDRDASQPTNGILSERLYALADANGNIVSLYDVPHRPGGGLAQRVIERIGYAAYGRAHFMDKDFDARTATAHDWNILFGGYYYDRETGLYHVRNRFYDPNLGRFLQTDPSGFQDSYNLYQYALSAPQTYLDPTGEALPLILLAGALAIGAAHGWSETMLATEGQATGRQQLVGAGLGGLFGAVNPVGAYSSATGAAAGYWGGRLTGSWDPVAGMQWGGLAGGVGGGFGSAARQAYRAAAGDLGRRAAVRAAAGAGARRALPEVYGAAAGAAGFASAGHDPLHGATLGMFAVGAVSGAGRLALSRRRRPTTIYSVQQNIQEIRGSGRVWGQTEGVVWGMGSEGRSSRWRAMIEPRLRTPIDPGVVVFEGSAAALFQPRPISGIWSGIKNVLGQHTTGFGDVVFNRKTTEMVGRRLVVREATVQPWLRQHRLRALRNVVSTRGSDAAGTQLLLALGAHHYARLAES
jgi:RHS repeat-associated protein